MTTMKGFESEVYLEIDKYLKIFYDKCGGVIFNNTRFRFEIVSPKEIFLINVIIVGELCEEDISSE